MKRNPNLTHLSNEQIEEMRKRGELWVGDHWFRGEGTGGIVMFCGIGHFNTLDEFSKIRKEIEDDAADMCR
jgi:hypothetical protein